MTQKVPAVMALTQGRLLGASVRTQFSKNQDSVSVFDFLTPEQIADVQSGTTDHPTWDATPYINLATGAADAHGGNIGPLKRKVILPAGNWLIEGPVYVRKGQWLCGDGFGSTRVRTTLASSADTFVLGEGLVAGVPEMDPGGLAAMISDIHIEGGNLTGSVVRTRASGAYITRMFFTSPGIGISVSNSGDVIITDCIFDQGLNGIVLSNCQNVIIANCLWFLISYQIVIASNTINTQILDCHFEYTEYSGILFAEAATGIRDIMIKGCQFLMNGQYDTFLGFVHIRTGDFTAVVDGCTFNNMYGYAVAHRTGIGGELVVQNCVFDGNKTNTTDLSYHQSTTAAGIFLINDNARVSNCVFRNLLGIPILTQGDYASQVDVVSCKYSNNAAPTFVSIINTGTNGTSYIRCVDNIGDGVKPLINLQNTAYVSLKGNVDWLGAAAVSGGRRYWLVPTFSCASVRVGITANPNPGGNQYYRKTSVIIASRFVDYNGAAVADFAAKHTVYEAPDASGFVPVLDIAVALDAVGGPANATFTNPGRYLAVSIPDGYTAASIHADFETASV